MQFRELCLLILPLKVSNDNILFFRFSYYTAGTGGAGPTILATSFLLLGEEVVAYSKGQLKTTQWSQHLLIQEQMYISLYLCVNNPSNQEKQSN